MFGEDVEDEDKAEVTVIPSSTDAPSTVIQASTIAIESSSATLTTEALRELLRVLDQPEDLTTSPPVVTTEKSTTTTETLTSSVTQAETSHEPTTSAITSEATATQSTVESSSSFAIVTQEAATHTESPATTSQPPTSQPNYFDNIFPTAFDKLLTTLKEFVAQADAATSTEAPKPATTVSAPQLEQKLEFVNFTVSEQHNEEPKLIVKRSVAAVDLNPRYYKQQALSLKEKGCNFNGRNFRLGEIIKTDNDCLKCICEYEPIGHCVLKEKCDL